MLPQPQLQGHVTVTLSESSPPKNGKNMPADERLRVVQVLTVTCRELTVDLGTCRALPSSCVATLKARTAGNVVSPTAYVLPWL